MNKKTTLATQCASRLEAAILEGDFLPGQRLRNEELKSLMNMGLSPIREALAKLAETGLLRFEDNKGYSVAKMSEAELLDALDTYAEIECLCLRRAMENGDDNWESRIVAALYKLKKLELSGEVDYRSWAPANREFHEALVSACPIKGLLQARRRRDV